MAEVVLLNDVTTAQDAVGRRDQVEAGGAPDACIEITIETLRPELDGYVSGRFSHNRSRDGSLVSERYRTRTTPISAGIRYGPQSSRDVAE